MEYALAIIENRRVNDSKQTIHERKEQMKQYETFVQSGQVVFTTFHQSYGYEEFVQGIRPNLQAQTISFQKTDGILNRYRIVPYNIQKKTMFLLLMKLTVEIFLKYLEN